MRTSYSSWCLTPLLIGIVASNAFSQGPYHGKTFQGRIAYSADGNHNDPDDWAASPVALAIFAGAGLKDRLVHFDYNCILPETNPEWEKIHAESVLGTARRYGYDLSLFHDCRKDLERAVASLAKAVDACSAENPLYFIVAGPMEVPVLGLQKAQQEKRKHVYCISHSRWNDGFASRYKFTHTKRNVIETGVNWVQIRDQNPLLSLSPYGKPAPEEAFQGFRWMRDAGDDKLRFVWDRLLVSTRPDPSDAGMAYFLATGDETCDPVKLRRLLAEHAVPAPVAARKQIRLEAENFRYFDGYELEDRKDKQASHQLGVKPLAGRDTAAIRTQFQEPFAAAEARYDVELRYFVEDQAHPCQFSLTVCDVKHAAQIDASGTAGAWKSQFFRDVAVRLGDEVIITATGTPLRLDYLQLNLR